MPVIARGTAADKSDREGFAIACWPSGSVPKPKVARRCWAAVLLALMLLATAGPAVAAGSTGAIGTGSAGSQATFTDIKKNWAEPDISELVLSGVIVVPKDRLFHPNQPISRLDFAVWMARAQELPLGTPAAKPPFKDWAQIPQADQPLVAAAVRAGLLKGYPDGTFGPQRTITRLEIAVILGRVLEGYGEHPDTRWFLAFVDGKTIPAWADAAALPLQDQIMFGEPAKPMAAIAPYRATTRAETAALILRYLQYRTAHYHTKALPKTPAAPFLVGAWDSNSEEAYQVLLQHGTALNWLVYTGYNSEPDGSLQGYDSPRTLNWVSAHPMPLQVMVQNDWPNDNFLHDSAAEHKFVANILGVLQRSNYAGVNIDFEGIAGSDRGAFSQFIGLVSSEVHAHHFVLSVDVPSETATDNMEPWAAAYDYAALAPEVDQLVLMAYDYHYPGGDAGPVGPLDWIRQVLAYTTSIMPSHKVILGIPAYGYLWGSNGHSAAYWEVGMENQASSHGANITQNAAAQEGTFHYSAGGVNWVGWFVDAEGLAARLQLAHQENLGGVIFWRLDYNAPDWWPVLTKH